MIRSGETDHTDRQSSQAHPDAVKLRSWLRRATLPQPAVGMKRPARKFISFMT